MATRGRALRRIRRRTRRVLSYWRAESGTLRQGAVALSLSTLAGFVAGFALASIAGTLEDLPGLIILIPAAVGVRGAISGAMGARLGTSTHAGTFEVTWDRTGVLAQNVRAGTVLTLGSSVYVAGLAKVSAIAFGLDSISLVDLITISVAGSSLGSGITMIVTVWMAVTSYRRGYDLDAVATPMVTAVGDMVTIPALFAATFITRIDRLNAAVALVGVVVAIAAVARSFVDVPAVRRMLLEMVPVIMLTPVLDILAGTLLQSQLDHFVAYPVFLMLLPPFVSQAGALGGILSSRLSSKLRLGVLTPTGVPEQPALIDAVVVSTLAAGVFALIGFVAYALSPLRHLATPGAGTTIAVALTAGLLTLPLTLVIGYYLAVVTFRFGLDPDNHGVPVVTSTMDLAGVVCLLLAMTLWGVT
ncbi:MAG TPA: magnesium transporter [Actinomycetota bacterium]|nr:magnesium transporter [Actinomycetota bacterium]